MCEDTEIKYNIIQRYLAKCSKYSKNLHNPQTFLKTKVQSLCLAENTSLLNSEKSRAS